MSYQYNPNRYNIVIGLFLAMASAGMVITSFGVFFKPVSAEFGWARAETSGAFSLATIISGIGGLIAGRIGDRFEARFVVVACGAISGLAFLLLSQMTSLWQIYFYYGILVGTGLSSVAPASSLIARWYKRQRGLMTGISMSGAAIFSIIIPTVATWLINTYSWHISYLVIGAVVLLNTSLSGYFLFRTGNLKPSSDEKVSDSTANPSQVQGQVRSKDKSFREAVLSRPFWYLSLLYFCFHYILSVVAVHIVPHATDLGISPVSAALILTISSGANIVGSYSLGSLNDRIGSRKSLVIGLTIMVIACVLLLVSGSFWLFCVFSVIYGIAWGGTAILRSIMVADLFGLSSHGTITGALLLIALIGGTISPILTGYIFDITGKYLIAFFLTLGLSIVALLLALSLQHRPHQ